MLRYEEVLEPEYGSMTRPEGPLCRDEHALVPPQLPRWRPLT